MIFIYNRVCILFMGIKMKIARVTKIYLDSNLEDEDPYKVFVEISEKYGTEINQREIKKELENRF